MPDEPEAGSRPGTGADTSGHLPALALAWACRAVPLVIVLALVTASLPGLPWWLGVVLGLLAATVWILLLVRGAATRLLNTLGATPAAETDDSRLLNLVEGLYLSSASSEPEVYIIDSRARNGAAVAQGDTVAVVVTTGLLRSVDRIGLEAVVAEVLVRLGNGDARSSTLAAALFGPLRQGPLAAVLAPIADIGVARLLGRDRELEADRAAVSLTRYPPGLLAALDAVRAGTARVEDVSPAFDHVWIVPPPSVGQPSETTIATPLDLRIDVLAEL